MQRVKMRLTKSQYCFLFHICLVDWMARFFFSSFFCVYYLRRKKLGYSIGAGQRGTRSTQG